MKFLCTSLAVLLGGCVSTVPPPATMKTVMEMRISRVVTASHYEPPEIDRRDEGTKIEQAQRRYNRAFDALTSSPVTHDYENRYVLIATDRSRVEVSEAEYKNAWVGKLLSAGWH